MLTLSPIDWLIFLGVPFSAWLLGYLRRGQTTGWRGYFLASGMLPTSNVAANYVGANVTFTTIFLLLCNEAYRRGAAVFCVPIFWFAGSLLFTKMYHHLRPHLKDGKTLHQALCDGYGSQAIQKWASLWTIVAFIGTVGLEFYGASLFLQWAGFARLSSLTLALILAFLCSIFTYSAGLRGIGVADYVLDGAVVACCFVLVALLFMPNRGSVSVGTVPVIPPLADSIVFVVAMAVLFIPFQFCVLDSWQRCAAWQKKTDSPGRWLLLGALVLSACYSVPILIGLKMRTEGLLVPDGEHPLGAFLEARAPGPFWRGLIFAGFISAVFSTADELLNCASLTLLFDVFRIPRSLDDQENGGRKKRVVASGQFYTGLFAFVSALVVLLCMWLAKPISELALAVFSGQIVFAVPLFLQFWFPRKPLKMGTPAVIAMFLAFVAGVSLVVTSWIVKDPTLADAAPIGSFFVALTTLGIAMAVSRVPAGETQ